MISTEQNKARTWALSIFMALFLGSFSFQAHANSGGEGEGAKPAGPIYVDFKNIVVPIIQKNGRTGVVALSMMAEAKDQEGQTVITQRLPKLRDAFIRTLYGNMEDAKFVRADGNLNIDYIKERLIKTAAYVMKDDKENPIKDILFQNIAQQRY